MRKLMLGAVLAALAFPAASHAQFNLGLRLGYAPAMGDAAKDFALKDAVKSQVPVQVDALYKVTPEIGVGAYFSYGIGQAKLLADDGTTDMCSLSGIDCSSRVYRAGIQVGYTFTQLNFPVVPWAAIGTGYEWANAKFEDANGTQFKLFYSGWEIANVQLGGDYKVTPNFAVGPYVQFSFGRYSNGRLETNEGLILGEGIENKAVHEWLNFGVRGKFDL